MIEVNPLSHIEYLVYEEVHVNRWKLSYQKVVVF